MISAVYSGNRLKNEGLVLLAGSLPGLSELKVLDLACNGITMSGLSTFTDSLTDNIQVVTYSRLKAPLSTSIKRKIEVEYTVLIGTCIR